MKNLSLVSLACGLLCCAASFVAWAKDKPPASQVLADQKLSKSTAILKEPIKDILVEALTTERVGEVYRLWLSINPTDYSDLVFASNPPDSLVNRVLGNGPRRGSGGFECYGFLKINDVIRWKVFPDAASKHIVTPQEDLLPPRNVNPPRNGPDPLKFNPRKQGYPINRDLYNASIPATGAYNSRGAATPEKVYEVEYNKHRPQTGQLRLELRLTDRDAIRKGYEPLKAYLDTKDDLFGDFKTTVDLTKLGQGDGHYYWFWNGTDDHGKAVGSQLYLHVEHVRGLYEPIDTGNGVTKPQIDPKIADKKMPVGKPGPGPVVKPQVKQGAPAQKKAASAK